MATDLKAILIAAATAAAAQVAADPGTNMKPADVPDVVSAVVKSAEKHPDLKEAQKTLDAKTNQEPWYLSVQAWTAIVSAILAIFGAVGLAVPEEIRGQIMAAVPLVVGAGVSIAMIYNRYFRFKT